MPFASPLEFNEKFYIPEEDDSEDVEGFIKRSPSNLEGEIPGILRFGKRSQSFVRFGRSADELSNLIEKKQVPGVLRFGKRSDMPGVLRFGKRSDMPGVLRFGKRELDMPGVLRFGKRDQEKKNVPGVLRFGKRSDMPGVLRFGKRSDMPGVLRFGKRSDMPGVLRFGKRDADIPGVLRFGKRFEISFLNKKSEMPGVLRFGRRWISFPSSILNPTVLSFICRLDRICVCQQTSNKPKHQRDESNKSLYFSTNLIWNEYACGNEINDTLIISWIWSSTKASVRSVPWRFLSGENWYNCVPQSGRYKLFDHL